MKNLSLLFFAAFLALTSFTFSQSTIMSNDCSVATPGWTFTNSANSLTGALLVIQQGGYWLLDNTGDQIITASYNVSAYTTLTFTFQVATYGSGTNHGGLVEYSSDGGSTWSGTTFLTAIPTGSSPYISTGTWNLGTIVTTALKFRITLPAYGTGKGLRIDNFLLQGVRPITDGDGSAVLSNVIGSGNLNNTTVFQPNTSGQSVKLEVTGTAAGTFTGVSVTIPLSWGWDGTSVAPSGDDAASLTGQTITGDGSVTPYTISYTGSITVANIARITISNLTSGNPSAITDNGNYPFIVKTKATTTLAAIASSPVAYVIVPMSHIRNEVGGVPVLNMQYVATVGVATVASGVFITTQLQSYMQDATAGCNLFSYTPTTIVEGESYIVKGQVQQYNGNTELVPLVIADIIDNGASVMPAYQVVTLADLRSNPELYEGMYIAVQDLSRDTTTTLGHGAWPTTSTAVTLTYNDISGDSLHVYIYGATDIHTNPEPVGKVDIKGIYSQVASGYQLIPRYFAQDFAGDWALPVELSSFTSNVNGRNVNLAWETKTEKNSDKFIIERNTISGNWSAIGTVKAAVLSNSPKQYSFSDKNLNAGVYQYRLKMIDNDGSFKYSSVTEASVSSPKNFELLQNYPNPFNPSTKINYNLPSDARVTLDIYNVLGVKVGQLVNRDQAAGFYSVDFNSSLNKSISSGVYLYKITAVDKVMGNSFSAIKKMMLLK
jgi:hypothetical protein